MSLIRSNGFVRLRRGLFEHVSEGKITAMECFLYTSMIAYADPSTGIWNGSAGLLAALFSISDRTCRDCLERLEIKGYLKRFTIPGKHGSYPILINRFECSDGAAKGKIVNAMETMILQSPSYFSREDGVEHNGNENVEDDGKHSAGKYKRLETRNTRKKPLPKDEPSDTRFSPFKESFEAYYRHEVKAEAPWDAREGSALKKFLQANPAITQDDWRKVLNNRVRSPGLPHAVRLSKWIDLSLAWLNGTANEWGKPIGGNGNGRLGETNPSPAKQRIDGARKVLAQYAIDRGLINPSGFDGKSPEAVSGAGPGGERSGVPEGLRAAGDGLFGDASPAGSRSPENQTGPEILPPAR